MNLADNYKQPVKPLHMEAHSLSIEQVLQSLARTPQA